VLRLLGLVGRLGMPVVAITGGRASRLARAADVVLDSSVPAEACPLGLAPTSSTTVAMALGDALAVALLEERGFTAEDFAVLHPAGALGRRLTRVDELMHAGDALPQVPLAASLGETLAEISGKRLGITTVVDGDGGLAGVVTDGDLRRALQRPGDPRTLTAADVMTRTPKTIDGGALAAQAVALMERHAITQLVVVAPGSRRPTGVLHLHDCLRAGVV
jgi:arabinose-5-phosphate isomerase